MKASDANQIDTVTTAKTLMETLPFVMGFITTEVRRQDPDKRFTLVQLRVLNILRRKGTASLKELAEELGVKLPTASVLVVRLVKQKLLKRQTDKLERRKVALQLTDQGLAIINNLNQSIFSQLFSQVDMLPEPEKGQLYQGALLLQQVLQGVKETPKEE